MFIMIHDYLKTILFGDESAPAFGLGVERFIYIDLPQFIEIINVQAMYDFMLIRRKGLRRLDFLRRISIYRCNEKCLNALKQTYTKGPSHWETDEGDAMNASISVSVQFAECKKTFA